MLMVPMVPMVVIVAVMAVEAVEAVMAAARTVTRWRLHVGAVRAVR